jgi:DNA replication and repair protein RecF
VWVSSVGLRDFRSYHEAHVEFGAGLTVVTGANGAGKTNLLEALYFGCTGRSCRTANERELVHFGAGGTRVEVVARDEDGQHELSVGFVPGQPKHFRVDGAVVEKLIDAPTRPLISVFLPDRLELIKGAPALRRAHLDQFVAALWPARVQTRRAYGQALAQRNALIARIRSGRGSRDSLASWDLQLARHGIALMEDRGKAADLIAPECQRLGSLLGLEAELRVAYRPRSKATTSEELAEELAAHLEQDLERGFSAHGPHRDELSTSLAGRDLRAYGSQGQQRIALLAILLAEREVLAAHRSAAPVMLLDDVMSELDHTRRQALVELLLGSAGQAVITTTDVEHVPGATAEDVMHLSVADGAVFEGAVATG